MAARVGAPSLRSLPADAMEIRLRARTYYALFLVLPSCALMMAVRLMPDRGVALQLAVSALPTLCILGTATALPKAIPPASAKYAAMLFVLFSALDASTAVTTMTSGHYPTIAGRARGLVSWSWVAANLCLAFDVWRRRGARFWAGLRLTLTVGNGLRLVCCLYLNAVGASNTSFPPGNLSFESAVRYNCGCVALATVGLSPWCRRFLSEWMGSARVVLSLGNVQLPVERAHPPIGAASTPEDEAGVGGAAGAEQAEDDGGPAGDGSSFKSWCTLSEASTTRVDNEGFAFGPLNSREFASASTLSWGTAE